MTPNLRARLTLELARGLGLTTTTKLIEALGSAESVVEAPAARYETVEGVGRTRASKARRAIDEAIRDGAVDRELERVDAAGVSLLCPEDAAYPRLLRYIPDPPNVLWVRGDMVAGDALAAAIVGSRRCSLYGREQADRFGGQIAEAGLTVVSGGAYGIDKAAHDAAIAVRGRTIAVIGSGLGKPYPPPHRPLFDRIAGEGWGAVVSEFPMQSPVSRQNFHRRNRLISGLSLGTLVVEAGRHSGALITARQCVEDHGRDLTVLPGRVDSPASVGCHRILREGWGQLVTKPAQVIETADQAARVLLQDVELLATETAKTHEAAADGDANDRQTAAAEPSGTLFDGVQATLLDALSSPRSVDELAAVSGLDVSQVQSELTMLQVRGQVAARGGLYHRLSRPPGA